MAEGPFYRLREIADRVSIKDTPGTRFVVEVHGGVPHVRLEDEEALDRVTGEPSPQHGRWWRLSPHMTDGEVAQTCLMALLAYMEHEAREVFLVDGVACFGPHFDLDKLIAMASQPDAIKERP